MLNIPFEECFFICILISFKRLKYLLWQGPIYAWFSLPACIVGVLSCGQEESLPALSSGSCIYRKALPALPYCHLPLLCTPTHLLAHFNALVIQLSWLTYTFSSCTLHHGISKICQSRQKKWMIWSLHWKLHLLWLFSEASARIPSVYVKGWTPALACNFSRSYTPSALYVLYLACW